jgi:dTDP-4-dehydrorhamnose 3,5-epimerase
MKFTPTPVAGTFLVDLEPRGDDRGFFARAFCANEFSDHGLETSFVQANTSFSARRGTLRGLHYQLPPSEEVKLVRCVRGALWDVVLDRRVASPSLGRWFGAELTAENRRAIYIPRGCAHGFITLTDQTEVSYMVSGFYDADLERGVRWDDPAFGIEWPMTPEVISDRDRGHPDYHASGDALNRKDA